MSRYGNNLKNTSDYVSDLLNEFIKVPRTAFDDGSRKIIDVTPYGIFPIDVWEMLPNSDAYLQYNIQMISKTPTIKRMLSGMTVELRTYKVNYNDCWEGWNNFITKGRSGKVSKSIPYLDFSLGSSDKTTCLPYNPAFTLGIAPSVFIAKNGSGDDSARRWRFTANCQVQKTSEIETSTLTGIDTLAKLKASTAMRVSALPFVMYNKVVKVMSPSNLLQDNPHWYPENENHDMLLPYDATGAVTTSDYANPTKAISDFDSVYDSKRKSIIMPSVEKASDSEDADYVSYPWLNVLQYCERKGDYFNTGSPFPDLIRGDVPTLEILNATASGGLDFTNAIVNSTDNSLHGVLISLDKNLKKIGKASSTNQFASFPYSANGHYTFENYGVVNDNGTVDPAENVYELSTATDADLLAALNSGVLSNGTVNNIMFSMSQFRYLATMTVLRERLALTDGSYNELIKAMFGHNPRWHNHEPIYCGGFTQPIVFSEVVNTAESATAPLGDTAGRAVTSGGSQQIHVHSDDYGMFMTVLMVRPDEYYNQGVDKMWSRLENAEQYLPILNNLSPDATKNKEIFVSGTNADDEDVFNHQERFAYYKSRRNHIAGLLGMPISKVGDTGAYVMNRTFGSTPQFNAEFTRGELTSNERAVFASTEQAEFAAVIGSAFKYVGPIPRDSRPSNFGISY